MPGAYLDPNVNLKVNGSPANTASFRIEGQDANNGYVPGRPAQNQTSVDAIQEVTIQTSNYAAEYGQVGGGFFNYTMKSGTNQFHGTAYDYFANEVLNAGTPFYQRRPGKPASARGAAQRLRRHDRRSGLDSESLQRPRQDLLLFQL